MSTLIRCSGAVVLLCVCALQGCGSGSDSDGTPGAASGSSSSSASSSSQSSSASSSSQSSSPGQPTISASVLAFPPTASPQVWVPSPYDAVATVRITDQSQNLITNANVSVNGTSLSYEAAAQEYIAYLSIVPGAAVTVSVTVAGATYTASRNEFSTYPTILAPLPQTTWASQANSLISWSGSVPDSTAVYVLGATDANGSLEWPAGNTLLDVVPPQSSYSLASGALSPGNVLVIVGIADYVPIPGAAANSALVLAGFNYSPITVVSGSIVATSITTAPASITLVAGKSVQLSATATSADVAAEDITTQATWSSSNSSVATVDSSGEVTGVAPGTATISAEYQGLSAQTAVTVFQPNPSPLPPLTQAVAYQIDYAHSGFATVGTNGPIFPPTASWSATLNGLVSYPVIAGGSVFVTTNGNQSTNPNGASLYALDESTGRVLWGPVAIPSNDGWSGHAYDHGQVFVVNDGGTLSAFNAATGSLAWSVQLGQYAFNAPPTAVNGVVYVGGAGTGGTVFAVDEANGGVLWTAEVENGNVSSPAVSPDGVFVSYPCQVYKLDPLVGTTLWHYSGPCEGGGGVTSAYANGELFDPSLNPPPPPYTAPTGQIFDAETGAQLSTFSSSVIPAFSSTTGFFLDNATLTAVDQTTQSPLWSFVGDGGLVTAPIVIDDVVVIGSSTGMVYALNATSGSVIWQGNAGAAVSPTTDGVIGMPDSALGAGEGYLVVPAGNSLVAWRIVP